MDFFDESPENPTKTIRTCRVNVIDNIARAIVNNPMFLEYEDEYQRRYKITDENSLTIIDTIQKSCRDLTIEPKTYDNYKMFDTMSEETENSVVYKKDSCRDLTIEPKNMRDYLYEAIRREQIPKKDINYVCISKLFDDLKPLLKKNCPKLFGAKLSGAKINFFKDNNTSYTESNKPSSPKPNNKPSYTNSEKPSSPKSNNKPSSPKSKKKTPYKSSKKEPPYKSCYYVNELNKIIKKYKIKFQPTQNTPYTYDKLRRQVLKSLHPDTHPDEESNKAERDKITI